MSRFETKKVIVLLVVLVTLVQVALAAVAFVWHRQEADKVVASNVSLQAARDRLANVLSQDEAATVPVVDQRTWRLLHGPDVVPTLQRLQQLGDEAGVLLDSQKALRSTSVGKQSFALLGRGSPTQVCAFAAAIEQDPRLMVVETGRLLPSSDEYIAFEFGVATYHRGGK